MHFIIGFITAAHQARSKYRGYTPPLSQPLVIDTVGEVVQPSKVLCSLTAPLLDSTDPTSILMATPSLVSDFHLRISTTK